MHPRRLQSPQVVLRPLMLGSQLFLLSPSKLFPLVKAPRILRLLLLSFPRKEQRLSQKNRPPRLASVLFLSWLCCHLFFYFFIFIIIIHFIFFFGTLGFVVMKFYRMNEVFPFFFLYYMFIVVVITISMDTMYRNDHICVMLVIKP